MGMYFIHVIIINRLDNTLYYLRQIVPYSKDNTVISTALAWASARRISRLEPTEAEPFLMSLS